VRRTVIAIPASLAYGVVGFGVGFAFAVVCFAVLTGQWGFALVEAACLVVIVGVVRSSKKVWLPSPGAIADRPNLQPSDTPPAATGGPDAR